MSAGTYNEPGFRVFVPTTAASNGTDDHGGGLISGNGTYYSRHTVVKNRKMMSWEVDIVSSSGPLAGTITVQASNSSDDDVRRDVAKWFDETRVSVAWTSGSSTFGIALYPCEWGRVRLKIVTSAGTGTIQARVAAKE